MSDLDRMDMQNQEMSENYYSVNNMSTAGNNSMWIMHRLSGLIRMLLLSFVVVSSASAFASVEIKGIEFSSVPNDFFEINLTFDGEPPVPKGHPL